MPDPLSPPLALREPFRWPDAGVTRVPFRLFSDPEIYALEQERIFRGPVWHFLCLELEVENPGDFRTTFVGETPVIVTRDRDRRINAMVNRCAHKGALVCLAERSNCQTLSCIYHAWTYDLSGQLKGLAFRDGLRGKGGMPDDFEVSKHRLEPLRVAVFAGLVFGTFSEETSPLADFLGATMAHFLDRSLGRPLKLLGAHSQILHNNWKLYAENVRDPYHATLLHTFYTTFKINRLDMDGSITLAENSFHHVSFAKRATLEADQEYHAAKVHSAQYDTKLAGPALLESFEEFDDGITHIIQAIFPTLAIQFTLNSLAVRFFVPRGVEETELFWMFLGYQDDDEDATRRRIMQSNLTGAAGLISLEDGCINEFVQRGTRGARDRSAFMEMGGRDVASTENSRATETEIRGFWQGYRGFMGL